MEKSPGRSQIPQHIFRLGSNPYSKARFGGLRWAVVAPPPHKKPSQSQKRGAYLPVLTAGDLGPLFFKSAIGVLGRKPVAWLSGGGLPLFFLAVGTDRTGTVRSLHSALSRPTLPQAHFATAQQRLEWLITHTPEEHHEEEGEWDPPVLNSEAERQNM